MITPDYYKDFKCIGGDCKNNCCCGGWEIEVDDDALTRFGKIEGEFGERVRASVNDENIFIRKNGRCPMLSPDGLCEMVLNGEKLCVVCDEYPRFTECFDDYEERGISLSCEAAAEIILNNEGKLRLVGDTGKCDEDIFRFLYSARNTIFEILEDREKDIYTRIRLVLNYGEKLQDRINNNDYSGFLYEPCDISDKKESIIPFIEFLMTLDYLSDDWTNILSLVDENCVRDEIKLEKIAVYFIYRYFLKAAFDCDALSKLKFMALSVAVINALVVPCGNIYESSRRYSVEIEHNEENIDMIYDEFLFNEDLSLEKIIDMIK